MTKIRRDFWNRWKLEYLNELNGVENIKIGPIVIIADKNAPPLQWCFGRVIQTHPGEDGIIRAVTLRTQNSELKRSVGYIAPLPIDVIDSKE